MGIAGIGLKAAETKCRAGHGIGQNQEFSNRTMAYRDIGATGIKVSVFSMGHGKRQARRSLRGNGHGSKLRPRVLSLHEWPIT